MSETIQRLYAKEFEELHNQTEKKISMFIKNAYKELKNSGMNDEDIYRLINKVFNIDREGIDKILDVM